MFRNWIVLIFIFLPVSFLFSQIELKNPADSLLIKHNRIYLRSLIIKPTKTYFKYKRVPDDERLLGIIHLRSDSTKIKILLNDYKLLRKYKGTQGLCGIFSIVCFAVPAFYSFQLWNSGVIKSDSFAGVMVTSVATSLSLETFSIIYRSKRYKKQREIVEMINSH